MASIQTFSQKVRLRSNEILTFGRALETKIGESSFAEVPAVSAHFTNFKVTLQAMDDSMISGGKYATTPEMEAADKERDNLQTGLLGQIRIFENHYDATKKTHALHLKLLVDKYKNKTQKSYEEQTSITANLVEEAQSETYSADITALELTEWVTKLKEANDKCAALSAQNITERGARKTAPKLENTRKVFEDAYEALAKRFNALAEVNGDADYVELFTWWNALIDRYRLLLANRLGAGKGGTTDNGNSNQPDPGTGSEEEEEGNGNDGERPGGL